MMEIRIFEYDFSVCRVAEYAQVNLNDAFCFTGSTDQERSLVCRTESVPENVVAREDGWKLLRIEGVLDFSLIGILARITGLLADRGIPVFAISTFNTDYVLVKAEQLGGAANALRDAGYTLMAE